MWRIPRSQSGRAAAAASSPIPTAKTLLQTTNRTEKKERSKFIREKVSSKNGRKETAEKINTDECAGMNGERERTDLHENQDH